VINDKVAVKNIELPHLAQANRGHYWSMV